MGREDGPSPQPVILGFLMEGPQHPYGLFREFDRELGRVWRIGQAALYARLRRAEEEGLAEVEVSEAEGAPDRRVHRITAAGRRSFLAWTRGSANRVRDLRLEFLSRLYFYRRLGLGGLEDAVALQKAALEASIAAWEAEIAATAPNDYWRLVLEFRRSEAGAALEWIDTCVIV